MSDDSDDFDRDSSEDDDDRDSSEEEGSPWYSVDASLRLPVKHQTYEYLLAATRR